MQSGAYNDALRAAFEEGVDISGSGNSHWQPEIIWLFP